MSNTATILKMLRYYAKLCSGSRLEGPAETWAWRDQQLALWIDRAAQVLAGGSASWTDEVEIRPGHWHRSQAIQGPGRGVWSGIDEAPEPAKQPRQDDPLIARLLARHRTEIKRIQGGNDNGAHQD